MWQSIVIVLLCRRYGIARWPRQEILKAAAEKEAAEKTLTETLKPSPAKSSLPVVAWGHNHSPRPMGRFAGNLYPSIS